MLPTTSTRISPVAAISTLFLLAAIAVSLIRPSIAYDSWAYHLPFASYMWNIGGGESAYHMSEYIHNAWLGFPKIADWVQGAFWFATGSINAVVVPHIILMIVYLIAIRRVYETPIAWSVVALFSVPMILIHFLSTYIDLLSGLAVALGFVFLMAMMQEAKSESSPRLVGLIAAFVSALTFAANSKYQTWLACAAIVSIGLANVVFTRGLLRARQVQLLVALVCSGVLINIQTGLNLVRYKNPFYPIDVAVAGRTVFGGPVPLYSNYPGYFLIGAHGHATEFARPINFLLSVTELDWTMRGVSPWYNIDGNSGDQPRRGEPARTGGFGGVFFSLGLALLAYQLLTWKRLRDDLQRASVLNVTALIAITATFPQSHELRYWLYIPLLLVPINLRFLASLESFKAVLPSLLICVFFYSAVLVALSPNSYMQIPRLTREQTRRQEMPPQVLSTLRETGRYCDPSDLAFMYSTAATGVPGLVSQRPEDCQ